jgi:Tol biopolymer transport system component/tRNA A-37 threonylcarbamoyl transferase component Bud32
MPLAAGTRIGAYEIVAPLGAGGMGEVYRARDTKQGRDDALNLLPDAFRNDPDRSLRFEREAKTLAALNHPHIAQVYGFESAGDDAQAPMSALVMELVDGEDLAERISRGPVPLDEIIAIARQIADALEAAHEQGIVHRDLKPANVKRRGDGTVKVLDFGLAKALEPGAADARGSAGAPLNSPTVTSPAAVTAFGMILGTAAYMAPEQARGKPVDKRADIWAFGCVLYEMLTCHRAFAGDEVTETLARVLERDPDWAPLPPATPPALRTLLSRCLEKDPRRRLRDIGEARVLLETPSTVASGVTTVAPVAAWSTRRRILPWTVAAAAVGVAAATTVIPLLSPRDATTRVVKASIPLPDGLEVPQGNSVPTTLAAAPDGSAVAFTAVRAGQRATEAMLFIRHLHRRDVIAVPDSDGARSPFFSPDSKWVGFYSAGALKKVSASGGTPVVLARNLNNFWGAAWLSDGSIAYSNPQTSGEMLYTIADTGGEPTLIARVERLELDISFPKVLDAAHLITSRWTGGLYASGQIIAFSRQTNRVLETIISGGSHGQVFDGTTLVFARGSELLGAPFDAARRTVTGEAVKLLDGVLTDVRYGTPQFAVSPAGVLAYAPAPVSADTSALVSIERAGSIETLFEDRYLGGDPEALAGNARHIVYQSVSTNNDLDLWAYEIASRRRVRLTTETGEEFSPVLMPDGRSVLFTAWRGDWGLYRVPLIGGVEQKLAFASEVTNLRPGSITVDGRWLAVSTDSPYVSDVGVVDLQKTPHTVRWLVQSRFTEQVPRFAPTGQHIAYESDQLGRTDVWVVPFADGTPGEPTPVSRDGGTNPFWSSDGKELYFTSGGRLFAVTVDGRDPVRLSSPRDVLDARDLAIITLVDGSRFLAVRHRHTPVTRLELVLGWLDEVRQVMRQKE